MIGAMGCCNNVATLVGIACWHCLLATDGVRWILLYRGTYLIGVGAHVYVLDNVREGTTTKRATLGPHTVQVRRQLFHDRVSF